MSRMKNIRTNHIADIEEPVVVGRIIGVLLTGCGPALKLGFGLRFTVVCVVVTGVLAGVNFCPGVFPIFR